jgi:hypothetical protein
MSFDKIMVKPERRRTALAEAEREGLVVVYGDPYTIQLDLDSAEAFEEAQRRIVFARELLGIEDMRFTRSRSGNWHVYLSLSEPLDRKDRLLLAGVLGSDFKRTVLDWRWAIELNAEDCFLVEKSRVVADDRPNY